MVVERRAALLKQQRSIDTRNALLEGAARVFSRLSYGEARLRDIAAESGISEGAFYFHFGTKAEIAGAVLAEQQVRMTSVLVDVQGVSGTALDRLISLLEKQAVLISDDQIVQGGIRLAGNTSPEIVDNVTAPYFEWVQIVRALIKQGIEGGSVRLEVDVDAAAEMVNSLFVGAQVLAGLADSWASLPRRIDRLVPSVRELLRP